MSNSLQTGDLLGSQWCPCIVEYTWLLSKHLFELVHVASLKSWFCWFLVFHVLWEKQSKTPTSITWIQGLVLLLLKGYPLCYWPNLAVVVEVTQRPHLLGLRLDLTPHRRTHVEGSWLLFICAQTILWYSSIGSGISLTPFPNPPYWVILDY